MMRYETLILVRSESTADEISTLENKIEEKIFNTKGKMSSFDQWGKYRLAYPVQKNDYGVYILSRYEIEKDACVRFFKELDNMFKIKFNEIVMRYVSIKLEKDAPLVYAKPDPIEGGKMGNLDAFLKENKMEGLLSSESKVSEEKHPEKKDEQSVAESADQPEEIAAKTEKVEIQQSDSKENIETSDEKNE